MQQLSAVLPSWQSATGSEPLYYNAAFDWDTFRVYPTPAAPVGVTLRIQGSFQPTDVSESLPDFMWHRYREVIANGAKARLLALPGVVWANPALSAFCRTQFDDGIVEARMHKIHAGVTGRLAVAARRFG